MADTIAHQDLADRRTDGQRLIAHFQFLQDNYVDQALVKDALLRGLTQGEAAKALGMSKRTVNRHAAVPYRPYAMMRGGRADEQKQLDRAFMIYVWGSDEAARAAVERCLQYDRERLLVESE